ncbi:MAG: 2-C-methyl-D-erythritol 2,4-cyclodiphosphate synthase [Nitriliruptorales bacterium]|nr:2-C-methyl-D-erythritol 2,4-cyclodiphosphate synthase [Nitriliruptorales bacterium]
MTRVGVGIDVHPFASDGRPLMLCGTVVPGEVGLDGHSDGDVALHAIADALLGAAALGDLGERFGTDRPEHAGADSKSFLADVNTAISAMGFDVVNVDVTIVAQRPQLAPHRRDMRLSIARVLKIAEDQVSVKFTTTDQLGSIGRGEGIAAWAACGLDEVGITSGPFSDFG